MRVALDVHTLGKRATGNETYIRGLAQGLTEVARESLELVYYHTGAIDGPAWPGVHKRLWPHSPFVRIPISFPLALMRDRVEIAHFQYAAPVVCPCPFVLAVHDISFEVYPEYFSRRERIRMKLQVPHSARRAAHVVTISEFSRRELLERYSLSPERVSVTYLAAGKVFRPTPEGEDPRRDLGGLVVPERFILAVGNLQPRKNLARLLLAFGALWKRGLRTHRLVLVGQSAFRGHRTTEVVQSLGLAEAVSFTGYVTERQLVALYNLAEIFAYPSIYEGFGLPIVEAMACGTPVITSRAASMQEVGGDAVELIDPLSEAELTEALLRLIEDADRRERLRKLGLSRASEFSWDRTAKDTLAIYDRYA